MAFDRQFLAQVGAAICFAVILIQSVRSASSEYSQYSQLLEHASKKSGWFSRMLTIFPWWFLLFIVVPSILFTAMFVGDLIVERSIANAAAAIMFPLLLIWAIRLRIHFIAHRKPTYD